MTCAYFLLFISQREKDWLFVFLSHIGVVSDYEGCCFSFFPEGWDDPCSHLYRIIVVTRTAQFASTHTHHIYSCSPRNSSGCRRRASNYYCLINVWRMIACPKWVKCCVSLALIPLDRALSRQGLLSNLAWVTFAGKWSDKHYIYHGSCLGSLVTMCAREFYWRLAQGQPMAHIAFVLNISVCGNGKQ